MLYLCYLKNRKKKKKKKLNPRRSYPASESSLNVDCAYWKIEEGRGGGGKKNIKKKKRYGKRAKPENP